MDRVKKKELDFGNDKIFSILLRLAPPVMLAQLIQALYNIIDSFFIGNYSESRPYGAVNNLSDTVVDDCACGRYGRWYKYSHGAFSRC